MTTYDFISKALDLDPLDQVPDISSYVHEPIPAWNKGFNHFGSKENHPCYGKPLTEKHRNKIAAARQGSKASIETRLKMSEMRKGKPANCSMSGKKHSEETKQKIAAKSKGFSEATRKKQKEYMTGLKLSDEIRTKMSDSHKGKTHSEETRQKISAAAKQRWANR